MSKTGVNVGQDHQCWSIYSWITFLFHYVPFFLLLLLKTPNSYTQMTIHEESNQKSESVADLGPSEAEGRTDRQKERERQSASAYQWRVGAECSPAAPRLPAALSTSPADAGPPRSRSCPSTTGNPVENTAHLLKNTALLTQVGLCHRGLLLNRRLCLLQSTPQPGKHRGSHTYWITPSSLIAYQHFHLKKPLATRRNPVNFRTEF